MSSNPADRGALPQMLRVSRDHESNRDSLGDTAEAILMLAEWMADDLIALAESFHLDPDYLFREAVSVFAEALEEGGARQPPREVYRETH